MPADLAIETRDLTKSFGQFTAVNRISLSVPRGATFGLLGPNGAGKTTFIKMLLSAVHPTAGEARIFGRDARTHAARRPVGYLPENHRFPTYFTGAGMLDFYAALSGVPSRDRRLRIAELLELVGLADWGATRIRKYSKGMLQRLGLAQALMHRPELLILDEPTDGVDPVGRKQIRDVLEQLHSRGVTVFINSHLLVEVETYCSEVAILHKGELALTGSMAELTAGKGYEVVAGDRRLRCPDRAAANRAVDQLRAAGVEIDSVAPCTSTLEEVFLRTVQD